MLENKIALITGATSGIGLACAEKLAQSGSNLIISGRRIDRLDALAKRLTLENGIRVHSVPLDVRNKLEVQNLISILPDNFQDIDILINNAGLAAGTDLVAEANTDDWDLMIDTNLKGLLYVTRAVLPQMIKRNSGYIINIASTAGHLVYPGGSVYCATKHAVRAVAKTLQLELMEYDIRVSSVDPGAVRTEFSEVRFKGNQEKADNVYKGYKPLGPEDVADAVHFCLTRPSHMMISEMVLLATAQGDGKSVSRKN